MSPYLRTAIVAAALSSAAVVHGQTLTLEDAVARAIAASPQGAATAARADALTAAQDSTTTALEAQGIPVGE